VAGIVIKNDLAASIDKRLPQTSVRRFPKSRRVKGVQGENRGATYLAAALPLFSSRTSPAVWLINFNFSAASKKAVFSPLSAA